MAETSTTDAAICSRLIPMRFVIALLGGLAVFISNLSKPFSFPYIIARWEFWEESPLWIWAFAVYFTAPIPIGLLTQKTSAKWVIFGVMIIHIIAAFFLIQLDYVPRFDDIRSVEIVLLVVAATSRDVTYSMMSVIISKWSPPKERSFMLSILAVGIFLKIDFSWLCADIDRKLCYVPLILGTIWCAAWYSLAETSPDQQKRWISQTEKNYIKDRLDTHQWEDTKAHVAFPCKKIFTSKVFISLIFVHICVSYVNSMSPLMAFCINVHGNRDLADAIADSPYLVYLLIVTCLVVFGGVLSISLKKNVISMTQSRKFATFISLFPPLFCVSISIYWRNASAVALLTLILRISSCAKFSGTVANIVDIIPNFSGPLVATFITIDILCMVLNTFISEHGCNILDKQNDGSTFLWITTIVTTGVSTLAYTFYWWCGSAEEQPWSRKQASGLVHSRDTTLSAESAKTEEDFINQ